MKNVQCLNYTQLPSACSCEMRWVVIDEFPNFAVSESGDVVKISNNKRLKGYITSDGYVAYRLPNNKGERREIFAHRLVAKGFLPKPKIDQTQVAHKNGSRLNNHFLNLHWATPLQNHDDRRRHGTWPVGETNPRAKLTNEDVNKIRDTASQIKSREIKMKMGDLARQYEIHPSTLSSIVSGKLWPHIGRNV